MGTGAQGWRTIALAQWAAHGHTSCATAGMKINSRQGGAAPALKEFSKGAFAQRGIIT